MISNYAAAPPPPASSSSSLVITSSAVWEFLPPHQVQPQCKVLFQGPEQVHIQAARCCFFLLHTCPQFHGCKDLRAGSTPMNSSSSMQPPSPNPQHNNRHVPRDVRSSSCFDLCTRILLLSFPDRFSSPSSSSSATHTPTLPPTGPDGTHPRTVTRECT